MTDQKTAAANKLVGEIVEQMGAKFTPEFNALAQAFAKMSVTLAGVSSRLEAIEQAAPAAAGAKRQVRGAGAAATTKAKADSDTPNITNALVFIRHMMKKNIGDWRETYGTPENLELADASDGVKKHIKDVTDPAKRSPEYWSAVAQFLWKGLEEKDQEDVRTAFKAWTKNNARKPEQLQADGGEEEANGEEEATE